MRLDRLRAAASAIRARIGRREIAAAIVLVAVGIIVGGLLDRPDRIDDQVQSALPTLGLACATLRGGAAEYVGRFAAGMGVVHGLKNGLGDAEINQRPEGKSHGFPSGHAAAATYGASYLMRECAGMVPYGAAAAAIAAGFVGAARVEDGHHSITQVLGGAIIGAGSDLVLRRPRSRAWIARRWQALLKTLKRAFLATQD